MLNYVTLFVSPEEGTDRPENLTILVVRVVGHLVLCVSILWPCIYVVDPTLLGIECCWNIVLGIHLNTRRWDRSPKSDAQIRSHT
jgi:hypothetical protein